jgi:hypothetical protein
MRKYILSVNGMQFEFDTFAERNAQMNELILEGMHAREMELWNEDDYTTLAPDYEYEPKCREEWEQY